jgi:hypothetical protein
MSCTQQDEQVYDFLKFHPPLYVCARDDDGHKKSTKKRNCTTTACTAVYARDVSKDRSRVSVARSEMSGRRMVTEKI